MKLVAGNASLLGVHAFLEVGNLNVHVVQAHGPCICLEASLGASRELELVDCSYTFVVGRNPGNFDFAFQNWHVDTSGQTYPYPLAYDDGNLADDISPHHPSFDIFHGLSSSHKAAAGG